MKRKLVIPGLLFVGAIVIWPTGTANLLLKVLGILGDRLASLGSFLDWLANDHHKLETAKWWMAHHLEYVAVLAAILAAMALFLRTNRRPNGGR